MLNRENTIYSINENEIIEKNKITIQELPFFKKINLRINPNNKNHMSVCGKILGVILPIKSNTYAQNEKVKSIWLGPNEWLIIYNEKNDILTKLQNSLGDSEAGVTDVSENRTVIRLSGEKINILLSKFLILDLEKVLFSNLSSAQTVFVKVPIILIRNNNEKEIPQIDIITNRSYANYIFNFIIDGAENLDF